VHTIDLTYVGMGIHEEPIAYVADQNPPRGPRRDRVRRMRPGVRVSQVRAGGICRETVGGRPPPVACACQPARIRTSEPFRYGCRRR
jgi:hypothetical protein